jgi:hypothetical protein
VIEHDDVVGFLALVVDDDALATLSKGLNNFGRLGTGATAATASEGAINAGGCGPDFPGVVVCVKIYEVRFVVTSRRVVP